MREGKIVPAEIAVTLMKHKMLLDTAKGVNMFLIDGFPRSMEQSLLFEKEVCIVSAHWQCDVLRIGLTRSRSAEAGT